MEPTAVESSPETAPTRLDLADKTVYLVGTAHISQHSVAEVRRVLAEVEPDCVCVELDGQRLDALRRPEKWRNLNLGQALRRGKGAFLLANLALSSFQRRMGLHTGVRPGAELLAAVDEAEARGVPVELVDREIRTTLLRAWRRTPFFRKLALLGSLLASAFESPEVGEEELAKLQEKDTLSALLEEIGKELPSAKEVLIDERDRYMAERIRRAPGRRVVAVVGAGHLSGITATLSQGEPVDLLSLEEIPSKPRASQLIPWVIPGVVVALFVVGFFFGDPAKVKGAVTAWVVANGSLSALGVLLALGHPVTVVSAFVAAPLTSLNPTVGAGMVTGVVQAWAGKPRVSDLENVLDDLSHWQGWWRNRVSRVLLVFLFSNLGSSLGTFVAFGWLKDLV